jgi:hypothetical protein
VPVPIALFLHDSKCHEASLGCDSRSAIYRNRYAS